MEKPYIICHMVTSIDGRVTGDFLYRSDVATATEEYYRINREYHADAYACGRVTMEGSFTGGFHPDLNEFKGQAVPSGDHIADNSTGFYAVSFDRRGNVGWTTPKITDNDPGYGGAHIIEIVTAECPTEYLAYLRSIGVSYIIAGDNDTDIPLALDKLYRHFGIKKLLLEGGSIINGAFQRENLVDELSIVVAPVTAAKNDKPLFMDGMEQCFSLVDMQKLNGSAVWLNYKRI